MQLSVDKIMAIEGVIVRFIQMQRREVSRARDGLWDIKYIDNSLGGKYILQFDTGQCSTVRFSTNYDGVGDTIPEAFNDYLEKNKPLSTLYP